MKSVFLHGYQGSAWDGMGRKKSSHGIFFFRASHGIRQMFFKIMGWDGVSEHIHYLFAILLHIWSYIISFLSCTYMSIWYFLLHISSYRIFPFFLLIRSSFVLLNLYWNFQVMTERISFRYFPRICYITRSGINHSNHFLSYKYLRFIL